MKQSWTTRALVLKRSDLGETDRLLVLFTEALGKITAVARGARKPKSKMASHLEPGNITRFELAKGKTFYVVTAARIEEHFDFIDLTSMHALFRWLELLDKVTTNVPRQPQLFELAARGVAGASIQPSRSSLFELVLYSTIGYKLALDTCIVGLEVLNERGNLFSIRQGGIICADHGREAEDAVPISANAIKVLRLLQSRSWDILESVTLSDVLLDEIQSIARLQRYEVLEQDLKSDHHGYER